MAGKKEKIEIPSQMPKKYRLIKEIEKDKLYKANPKFRNNRAREVVENNSKKFSGDKFVTGTMYMFDYFRPKTQEELKYYDAKPCVLIFGYFITKSTKEKRVLGLNLHYYPPKIRYQVLNKVMKIYEGWYKGVWKEGLKQDIDKMSYYTLIAHLQSAHLEFGVREYDPHLMGNIQEIPPGLWSKACFTEGEFKKMARTAILNYWKQLKDDMNFINKAKKRALL